MKTKMLGLVVVLSLSFASMRQIHAADNSQSVKTGQNSGKQSSPKKGAAKLVNNGRMLSEKGINNIQSKDIISVSIKNDTVFIEVNREALTRLEKDKSLFTPDNSPKAR